MRRRAGNEKIRRPIVIFLLFCLMIIVYIELHMTITEQNANPIIITVWTKDRHDGNFWEKKIEEYNRTNTDNIMIKYRIYTDNYVIALESAFLNHDAPDIMAYSEQLFTEIYRPGRFADLYDYMNDEFRSTYSDMLLDGVNVIDGKCLFIPTGASIARLFINRSLLQRAGITDTPQTIEDVIQYARVVTEKFGRDGIYGFAVNLKDAVAGLERSLMKEANREIGLKNGYDFSKECYTFEEYEGIISNWRKLLSVDCAYPYCSRLAIDPLRQMFSEGKIAMYMSYAHAEKGVYENQFPVKDEWYSIEIPTHMGIKVATQSCSLNNGYLVNSESPHKEAAWKAYCAVFADIKILAEYYEKGLGTPVAESVIRKMTRASDVSSLCNSYSLWPRAPHEEYHDVYVSGADMYETIKQLLFDTCDISPVLEDLSIRYNSAYGRVSN